MAATPPRLRRGGDGNAPTADVTVVTVDEPGPMANGMSWDETRRRRQRHAIGAVTIFILLVFIYAVLSNVAV
jgi:hypothetical protein